MSVVGESDAPVPVIYLYLRLLRRLSEVRATGPEYDFDVLAYTPEKGPFWIESTLSQPDGDGRRQARDLWLPGRGIAVGAVSAYQYAERGMYRDDRGNYRSIDHVRVTVRSLEPVGGGYRVEGTWGDSRFDIRKQQLQTYRYTFAGLAVAEPSMSAEQWWAHVRAGR